MPTNCNDEKSNTSVNIEQLSQALKNEQKDRELALIAQEHRLLPAIANLARAWSDPDPETRSELWPKAVQALAWCLIPRTVTASISIVALFSLAITWWQTSILQQQTSQLQTQNTLIDAQRASSAMSGASEIFKSISSEKENEEDCNETKKSEECWEGDLFIPSSETTAKISILTNLLQPYKFLEEREHPCPDEVFNEYSSALSMIILDLKDSERSNTKALRSQTVKFIDLLYPRTSNTLENYISATLKSITSKPNSQVTELSCKASSPERGLILRMLAASQIDLAHLDYKGANFDNAYFQGSISAEIFNKLQINEPNLTNASIHGTLSHTSIYGATIGTNTLSEAKLYETDFLGTHIEINESNAKKVITIIERSFFKPGTALQIYNASNPWQLHNTLCKASPTPEKLSLYTFHAAVYEVRHAENGRFHIQGHFTSNQSTESAILYEGRDSKGKFEILYSQFKNCKTISKPQD